MQVAIPLLVVLAVVIVIGGLVALGAARLQRQRARDVHGTPTDTLRFPVPEGQDAAAIVTALKREGFSSVMEMVPTGQDIVAPAAAREIVTASESARSSARRRAASRAEPRTAPAFGSETREVACTTRDPDTGTDLTAVDGGRRGA